MDRIKVTVVCAAFTFFVIVVPTRALYSQVETVSFCDLIGRPANFTGRSVRTEATAWSYWHGWLLFDAHCPRHSAKFHFDCEGDKECKRHWEKIYKKTDRKGDVGRVKVVIVGNLTILQSVPQNENDKEFVITKLESVERIPRNVPWLGD